MTKKRERKDSVRQRLDKAHAADEDPDIDFDEVSEVYDLVLEQTRQSAEDCGEQLKETTDTLQGIRFPTPGPAEKLG